MTQLAPCPDCHRHVKVSEAACPFCAHPLADAFANLAPRAMPLARLGRAATFAFGGAVALSACGDNTSTPDAAKHLDSASIPKDAPPDATPDADLDAGGIPIYAAAPTDAAGTRHT